MRKISPPPPGGFFYFDSNALFKFVSVSDCSVVQFRVIIWVSLDLATIRCMGPECMFFARRCSRLSTGLPSAILTHNSGPPFARRMCVCVCLGFDPRTVQPVASRYTDYATRPTTKSQSKIKYNAGIVTPWRLPPLCFKKSVWPQHAVQNSNPEQPQTQALRLTLPLILENTYRV